MLGINPPVHDFAFFDLWAKPLGLLYLLQHLRERGARVSLIDCVAEGVDRTKKTNRHGLRATQKTPLVKPEAYRHIPRRYWHFGLSPSEMRARFAAHPKPDAILVTSIMTYWYEGVRLAIELAREAFPSVPIILGGIYATLCPEHAATLGADEIVPPNATLTSHTRTYPALDLVAGTPSYGILTASRGCPYACAYCASKVLEPRYTKRSPEEVSGEALFQIEHCGVFDFAFYDDALLFDRESHFYPLCDRLKHLSARLARPLAFHTPNGLHVRRIDRACARVLFETGFKTLRLSFEGIDPSTREASAGKTTCAEYETAVENLRCAGYAPEQLETYLLIGLPGQTVEAVAASIDFVKSTGGRPKLAEYSPIPGTPLFEEAARKIPRLRCEPLLANNSVYSTWIAGDLSEKDLQFLRARTLAP